MHSHQLLSEQLIACENGVDERYALTTFHGDDGGLQYVAVPDAIMASIDSNASLENGDTPCRH